MDTVDRFDITECRTTPIPAEHRPWQSYSEAQLEEAPEVHHPNSIEPFSFLDACDRGQPSVYPAWFHDPALPSMLDGGFYHESDTPQSLQNSHLQDIGSAFEDGPFASPCGSDAGSEHSSIWDTDSSVATSVVSERSLNKDGVIDTRHTCRQCQSGFATSALLEQHSKATRHRTFACQDADCKKTYYRRDTYLRHLSTHRRTNLHVCKVCEATKQRTTFKRRDHLKQHQRNCHPAMYGASDGIGPTLQRPDLYQSLSPREASVARDQSQSVLFGPPPGAVAPLEGSRESACGHCVVEQPCKTVYNTQPMSGIACALENRLGARPDEVLEIIAEQLDLHKGTSTDDLGLGNARQAPSNV